jgi:gamma-glutamyltranspeptidase/glutathione hydrolase
VAAGHPKTAEVGIEILADGGTAADAVVAMTLASCVTETVMSGLLAGCHAIVFDGSRVMNLDGFAAIPAETGVLTELEIPFGDEVVVYAIGPASCAVPGLPAALGALHERLGRLPWKRLCEPAVSLARSGVPLPEMHARSLEMFDELYGLGRGADLFLRDGGTLRQDELLDQPGLVQTFEALAEEGVASLYRGSLAEALLAVDGIVLTSDDLAAYRPIWRDPVGVDYCGRRVATRGGLTGVPELLPRMPALADVTATERVLGLVDAFTPVPAAGEHTTNVVAVDGHGRACVLTHSLGVGAGVWLPGFDTQLNNLLGESDIAHGEPRPGERLESRMAPTLVFDAAGLELAIGAAGATRLRTALATVLAAILDEGLDAETAVGLPRVHPTPAFVDAEPGVDESALTQFEESGRAAGIASITTSAESAASGARARPATHAEAARPSSRDGFRLLAGACDPPPGTIATSSPTSISQRSGSPSAPCSTWTTRGRRRSSTRSSTREGAASCRSTETTSARSSWRTGSTTSTSSGSRSSRRGRAAGSAPRSFARSSSAGSRSCWRCCTRIPEPCGSTTSSASSRPKRPRRA